MCQLATQPRSLPIDYYHISPTNLQPPENTDLLNHQSHPLNVTSSHVTSTIKPAMTPAPLLSADASPDESEAESSTDIVDTAVKVDMTPQKVEASFD